MSDALSGEAAFASGETCWRCSWVFCPPFSRSECGSSVALVWVQFASAVSSSMPDRVRRTHRATGHQGIRWSLHFARRTDLDVNANQIREMITGWECYCSAENVIGLKRGCCKKRLLCTRGGLLVQLDTAGWCFFKSSSEESILSEWVPMDWRLFWERCAAGCSFFCWRRRLGEAYGCSLYGSGDVDEKPRSDGTGDIDGVVRDNNLWRWDSPLEM